MLLRLVHKVDFEGLMAAPTWSRSAHFALHHVAQAPAKRLSAAQETMTKKLSTDLEVLMPEPVDKFSPPAAVWFGAVVPKRLARRAVTRALFKRQIRAAFQRHATALPRGLWLVRLRRPFAVADFVSASSSALAAAARHELDDLLTQPSAPRQARQPRPGDARPGR